MTIGKSSHRDHRSRDERNSGAKSGAVPGQAEAEPAASARPAIGKVLAEARLAAGLTVDEVSASTRVRIPIVHAIEGDDFGRCGGDFYARGHIRSIARAVGVDGDALVAQYDAEHGGAPASKPAPQLPESGPIKLSGHRRPSWTGAMMLAIVAVVAVIGFNLFTGKSGSNVAGSASVPLPSASGSASPSAVQPPAPAPSAAVAAAPADKVTVKLVADKGTSWVSAVDSTGKSLFQNNLEQGQDQTFTDAKQIKLVVGNAGAVHVYVNGKDLGAPGDDGQVVHLTYTPGDPQAG